MKILSLILFITLTSLGCQQPTSTDTIISGQITNANARGFTLTGSDFIKQISINSNGQFSDTLQLKEGYYTLSVARRNLELYLTPGDNLNIVFDVRNFRNTIALTGSAAPEARYLSTRSEQRQKFLNRNSNFYQLDEVSFKKEAQERKTKLIEILDTSSDISSTFKQIELQDIEYYATNQVRSYEKYHIYYSKNENFKASSNFLDGVKKIDLFNTPDYIKYPTYREICREEYGHRFNVDYNKNFSYAESFINVSESIPSGIVRDKLMMEYMPHVFKANASMEQVYKYFNSSSTNEDDKKAISNKYKSLANLAPGNNSPNFNYENIDGSRTTLNELKGKYVYIDFWATWCGPCKREIPHLKELEEEYKDKNIAFVSISVDKPEKHSAWKKMVKDKELGGYQLITENATNSPFVQYFKVSGIPHFVLLDPEGNIYSAYAPRASNPSIKTLFDKLLI